MHHSWTKQGLPLSFNLPLNFLQTKNNLVPPILTNLLLPMARHPGIAVLRMTCVMVLMGVLPSSFVAADLMHGLGAPLQTPSPCMVLFFGLLRLFPPCTPMRLKGGEGEVTKIIKTGVSKPRAKGKSGKPLSKYNQYMQIEVPRVRADDSSLTHAEAFSVRCTSAARQHAPGRQKIWQQQQIG